MVALAHSHSLELEKKLQEYLIEGAEYIIGLEKCSDAHKESNGEHFHLAVEMDDKSYDSFRKTVLVNYYKLRGRAKTSLPRQYGIVKEVRDETKFLSYTCKDQNIITNITDKARLNKYIEDSYKREEKHAFEKQLFDYLDDKLQPLPPDPEIDLYKTNILILDYYRHKTDKLPALSTIRHFSIKYLYKQPVQILSTAYIYELMCNK